MAIDFDATYSVESMPGVAWTLRGYAKHVVELERHDPIEDLYYYELEEQNNPDWVIGVMVGDDRKHELDVDELVKIDDDDFCNGCGQIGCSHG